MEINLDRFAVDTSPAKFAVEINLDRFAVDTSPERFAVEINLDRFAVDTSSARFAVEINFDRFAVDTSPARLAVETRFAAVVVPPFPICKESPADVLRSVAVLIYPAVPRPATVLNKKPVSTFTNISPVVPDGPNTILLPAFTDVTG